MRSELNYVAALKLLAHRAAGGMDIWCSKKADVICFLTRGHRLRSDEPLVTSPREQMVTNRQKLVNEEGEPLPMG
jgi:hypothetical protein